MTEKRLKELIEQETNGFLLTGLGSGTWPQFAVDGHVQASETSTLVEIVISAGEYTFVGSWSLTLNGVDIGSFGPFTQHIDRLQTSSAIFTFDAFAQPGVNKLVATLDSPAAVPPTDDDFFERNADVLDVMVTTAVNSDNPITLAQGSISASALTLEFTL